MKKLINLVLLVVLMGSTVHAQNTVVNKNKEEQDDDREREQKKEYKVKFPSAKDRKVVFEMDKSRVKIEGYNGDEMVIVAENYNPPSKRAEGLRPLYNTAVDNSGIGLSVTTENNVVKVTKASRRDGRYTIRVPQKTAVLYEEVDWHGNGLTISDLEGDIEVRLNNSGAELKNVSGPVTANTTNGSLVVVFSNLNTNKPSSLHAVNGLIDVALPANTKANYKLHTVNGEIYTDFDVEIKDKDGMKKVAGGNTIEGTTNGGGVSMNISTVNSEIYLRKKK